MFVSRFLLKPLKTACFSAFFIPSLIRFPLQQFSEGKPKTESPKPKAKTESNKPKTESNAAKVEPGKPKKESVTNKSEANKNTKETSESDKNSKANEAKALKSERRMARRKAKLELRKLKKKVENVEKKTTEEKPKEEKPKEETAPKEKAAKEKKVQKPTKEDRFKELANYIFNYNKKRMNRRFFSKDFNKDLLPTIKFLEEKAKFQKSHFTEIMAKKPKIFLMLEKGDKYKIGQKISLPELMDYLEKELDFSSRSFRTFLVKGPQIVKYSLAEIQEFIGFAQGFLEISKEQMKRIMTINPLLITPKLKPSLESLGKVNEAYLNISKKEFGAIIAQWPFILEISPERIKENIKMFQKYNFSKEQIQKLLLSNAELLCNRPLNLERCFEIVKRFKMDITEKVVNLYVENPRLFTICPTTIMPMKYTFFRELGLTKEYIKEMFLKYPRIFVKSLKSTKAKIEYLSEVHKMEVLKDETFPAILNYNFSEIIRPRGEMMLRKEKNFPWKEILNLSDQEFCEKIGVTAEELQKVKAEIKPNNELDHRKRWFKKNMNTNDEVCKY